ncbi:MAG TPA: hypothetical protein VHZ09_17510 [Acidobacteriaceae bacterium]|nr:hypothetical protein [Acidobacteriaceae bacterium]
MAKPSQIILVVEDKRQQQLVYRYLRRRHFGPHDVRIATAPSGAGSAEHWVIEQFPIEVSEYRRRHAVTKLILVVDADTHSVHDRMQELEHSLKDAGVPRVEKAEQIAPLIPKRNIETWILCLNLEQVDEDKDYKGQHRKRPEIIPLAAETLCQWARANAAIPPNCVDSLRRGIAELQRIEC